MDKEVKKGFYTKTPDFTLQCQKAKQLFSES